MLKQVQHDKQTVPQAGISCFEFKFLKDRSILRFNGGRYGN